MPRQAVLIAALLAAGACRALPVAVAPDYARAESWLCRPGVDDGTCSAGPDAVAIDAAGTRTPAPYVPARAPPVDCFYVYPTVSADPTAYSDMAAGAEERSAVHGQAARLASRCRLFAPIYRQLTGAGLAERLRGSRTADIDWSEPYRDVRAAWRDYLRRDNRGRGFILVGHSQGAILLKRLIAEEIDGKPAQRRMVAAYLAGNPDLTRASFRSVPACASPEQTGCVVGWSTYLEGDANRRVFGGGAAPLCVSPAAPGGGRAPLKAYLPRPSYASAGDPPYVASVGQLTAECMADGGGAVLRVRIEPGRYAELVAAGLAAAARRTSPGWGLHPLDISLVQGNMLDLMASQTAAYRKRR